MTLLLLGAAVVTDIRSCRISNRLICSGWLIGLLVQMEASGLKGIGIFLRNISIPVILLYLIFLMHALGAGDIKLFSVIGGIWNLKILGITLLASFFCGGVFSLYRLWSNHNFFDRLSVFLQYAEQAVRTGQITPYPIKSSDGKQNIIHFSISILAGFLIALEVAY